MSKKFFINWLNEYWNDLTDIVSFSVYKKVRNKYLLEINNEHWIRELSKHRGMYDVELNSVLFILEKWLYRQAKVHDADRCYLYRDNSEGRTALIYRYLYNDENGLFYNYNLKKQSRVKHYKAINQFYMYWIYFSDDKNRAISLLKKINRNSYVVFMGLRRLGLEKEANEIGKEIGYQVSQYNPRISTTNSGINKHYTIEESLSLIKEAGFDTYDLSMMQLNELFTSENYLNNARLLKNYASSIGLICNQTHSIFPIYHPSYSKEDSEKRMVYTKRILEISKILGAQNCVIHPNNNFSEKENYDFYKEFLPLANELDINIAVENMWNWDDGKASLAACSNHNNFKEFIELVKDNHLVACVDIGHAELDGLSTSAPKMIESLYHYLKCIHIHDNDLHHDHHNIALFENIDFDLILDSLARIDYQGDLTFECDGFFYNAPKELHLEGLKLLYKIGLYLKQELLIRRKAICIKK